MKKILLIPLLTILAVSIVLGSCGGTEDTTTPATTSPATTSATTAPEVMELNFSYHSPVPASLTVAIIVPWANDLEAACGGRIEIIHHAAGALLGAADAYDGVLSGICDIAQVSHMEYPARFPRSDVSQLPFICQSTEVAGIVYHEIVNKYCVDTEYKDVKFLITLPLHPAQLLCNEPVETLEDFEGLRLRASGKIDSNVVTAFGGTPIQISTGDLFSALDTGMLDGAMFTFSGSLAFGLKDVTKYATKCDAYISVHHCVMNKDVYNSLPDDIKKIVDDFSTPETSRKYAAAHAAMEESYLKAIANAIKRKGDPDIYVVPDEELARWKAAAQPVIDEWIADMEAEGLPGQAIFDDSLSLIEKYSQ